MQNRTENSPVPNHYCAELLLWELGDPPVPLNVRSTMLRSSSLGPVACMHACQMRIVSSSGSTCVHTLDHFCIMGSVGDTYRCPLCARKGHGGYAIDSVGYPVCTVGANSCLGKMIVRGSNPCDIVGAALRCILKGTALFVQDDICAYVGTFLVGSETTSMLPFERCWLAAVLAFHGNCIHAPPLDEA